MPSFLESSYVKKVATFMEKYPKVIPFTLSCIISFIYIIAFHYKSVGLNILWIPSFVLIIFLSVYRFFYFALYHLVKNKKKINEHDWYQNFLYVCSLIFFLYGSISFKLNFNSFGLFIIWIWFNIYFMIIMASNVFYKKHKQDLISNILYLIKVVIVVIIFFAILIISVFSLKQSTIEYIAKEGIKGVIGNIASIAMILEIIKLFLTNFIGKDTKQPLQ